MKLTKSILIIALAIMAILSTLVYAGFTLPGYDRQPLEGTVITSTDVNFSFMVNNTNDGNTTFNLTVWNQTDRTRALNKSFGILFNGTINNGSFFNQTEIMKNGVRTYWKIEINNATTPVNTSMFVFNVDSKYYVQTFGSQKKINISHDTGDINISGNLHIGSLGNITMFDSGGTRRICGINATSLKLECT